MIASESKKAVAFRRGPAMIILTLKRSSLAKCCFAACSCGDGDLFSANVSFFRFDVSTSFSFIVIVASTSRVRQRTKYPRIIVQQFRKLPLFDRRKTRKFFRRRKEVKKICCCDQSADALRIKNEQIVPK